MQQPLTHDRYYGLTCDRCGVPTRINQSYRIKTECGYDIVCRDCWDDYRRGEEVDHDANHKGLK